MPLNKPVFVPEPKTPFVTYKDLIIIAHLSVMSLTNCISIFFRCLFFGIGGFFCLILLFLINSCQQKKTEPAGYSDAFKPVFDKVSVLFGTNRLDEGVHYIDSSLSHINKPYIDDRFRVYSFHYVYNYKLKRDYKAALNYADSMLYLANQSVNKNQYVSNYAEANFAIGDVYFSMGQYNNAYLHLFQGYIVGKNNLNSGAISDYNYRMGIIMYKMGDYKLAANYFKDCYQHSPETQDKFKSFYRKQEVLDNIALSYKHSKETDSALLYYNKALSFINQYAPKFTDRLKMIDIATGVVYGNEAEVLILKGDYTKAIDLLKKSIEINLKKGYDNNDAELTEIKLAKLYFDRNENDDLFRMLSTMRAQLDNVKNKDAETDWNRLMSRYYIRKKEFPKALDYMQNYNTLKDSNIKKLNLLRESNVKEQLDNYEKQYQINNLKDNNKIQLIYLYVAVICALMGFVIILQVVRYWKRSRQDVQIVNDLNKQVNIQKANLEKTLEELKSSGLEKDRILRTVAHDLRNPIGGIASLTLAMADDDYTDEQKELINLIKETSNNSLELINEILEVTNNGTIQLKKELVEINSLISRSVELLRFKAAEKNQQIKLELLAKPCELLISREKIWRVISNLISNAIKFSPIGGDIYVKISGSKNTIEITVKDGGIGIPENIKHKVFNMFTEAKRPGTAGEKSFGLGLSISKQIIENHDGKIWFENNMIQGTTFHISLPTPVLEKSILSKNQHTSAQMT
jgi:two-component system, OmpR family, sensor histidine kinase VicK